MSVQSANACVVAADCYGWARGAGAVWAAVTSEKD
jgi:hypothetical protein